MQAPSEAVLDVRGLSKHFPVGTALPFGVGEEQKMIHAVDDVSFSLRRGHILALVGESGSGKSTIARVLAGLYPATAGQVLFHGEDVLKLHGQRALLRYRSRVQMVFQDPFGSLNPVKTVAHHIQRPLSIHHRQRGRNSTGNTVIELLKTVGLTPPEEVARKFPHQLSGGQRQRVSFARALAVNPEVILADEPISMLDVSIRMGILNLMAGLREERGLSYLYITHDIASARYLADDTLVLYAGQAVEKANSEELISEPLHPYTQLLLSAVPDPSTGLAKKRIEARGAIPTVINPQPGCRFANRCPHVMQVCRSTTPQLIEVKPHHTVRCHLYGTAAV
ncbi:MAG: oligopeptide/dipeptide transporter, ATPase subunit [Chloroflexi bacterium]|nr:oligopeptide/dipeptide transporter, ATPase subunit [Chloroflexota bacterium]